MLRTISLVTAVAATLALPTAAWSGGGFGGHAGGFGGAHMGGFSGGHVGGFGGAHMGGAPMRSFGAVGNVGARSFGAARSFAAPGNFSTWNRGNFPRQAFADHDGRHFHHGRRFFGAPFIGAGLGLYGYDYAYGDDYSYGNDYSYGDSCWRYQQVPTAWGYSTQRVWVCGDDYSYGY